ncbi:zinc-binding dehydrogenase [Nocardioides nitrophenolicus]|uniref:zinc-binding dehydrogenase n=1 Tax=Nocardioides nitrophenolicus TaxID=60489 RepID=UPI00195DF054|nr:zinc-binding dehydrogenase [Nocardioides nitrophenolicus]MBM7518505.1 propanol-preferring alcohol dehydrogenase [Nocardioides nitrophenolicus]
MPPEQMSAWQWTGTGRPLRLHQVPVPRPGPDEVLVAVRAAGLCHSDVGELDEPSWAENITRNPITLGHEIAGEVVLVGQDVRDWTPGDRVGVHPLGRTVPGYGRDGGYAAFHVAPAVDLVAVPDGLSDELAAVGTDAGMTSHHAVAVVAGVRRGMRVGIIGLGGLGQLGAQLAVHLGAEVHAADSSPAALELAASWGLAATYPAAEDLRGLGLDAVIDFAGFGTTTEAAVHAIKVGGDVVLVGLGATLTTLTTADVVHQKARIHGSSGGTRADVEAVYRHLAEGVLTPVLERIDFAGIPAGIERLRAGDVRGRLVADLRGR